jgi:hypothetical protein
MEQKRDSDRLVLKKDMMKASIRSAHRIAACPSLQVSLFVTPMKKIIKTVKI